MRLESRLSKDVKRGWQVDRGVQDLYLVTRGQLLVAVTLRASSGPDHSSRFPVDFQPIPSRFSANFDKNSIETMVKKSKEKHNSQLNCSFHWALCQCAYSKWIRLTELSLFGTGLIPLRFIEDCSFYWEI
jgi:hypothetical protein